MKKNVASQSIGAEMITAADGTIFTGAVSVLYTIDNGTQTAGGGTAPVHEGNGYHSYTPLQAETNGDHVAFTFTGTGAISATIQVYTSFPQTVDNNVLAAGATGFAAIDTVVDAILVDTGTTIPAQITTAQNDLDIITGATGVNLLTATQASIDAIETDTSTTIPNQITALVVPPSVAQFDARTIPSADYFVVTDYTVPPSAASISTQVWLETVRTLTAGTNIVLAKGVGVTGFNDIAATAIVSGGAITTSGGNASVDVAKINGTVVIGAGTSGNLWRA